MRFAILGAGALGTILGAHLARAGHRVSMLARGARAREIERDGLIVKGLSELRERCEVITDPTKLRETDCFAVATKAIDTVPSLTPYAHVKMQSAFSMQNGVMKDELLAQVFSSDVVLGSMADFSGELLGSGEVLFTRNVGLHIGELPGGSSDRASALARTIDTAGVRCAAVDDIRTREWSKFVAWSGMVPLAAMTRLLTWKYLMDDNGARIAVKLVREVAQVAKAMNVPLMDLSPLPALTITNSSDEVAIEAVKSVGRRFQTDAPDHRMSVLQDVERGTRIEIEETLGFALDRARSFGLSVPTLELCLGLLRVGRS